MAKTADQEFRAHAQDRDSKMQRPFSFNRALARSGAAFSVTGIGDRTGTAPKGSVREGQAVSQIAFDIKLQDGYVYTDDVGEDRTFSPGDEQVLLLDRNPIRERDAVRLASLIKEYGEVTNLALQEFPTKVKGQTAHGIVHRSDWKTLGDLAKERADAQA
jgi:hypothetical protein